MSDQLRPSVPAYGYEVPPSTVPAWYAGGDPLVTAPGEGFNGWFMRLFAILRHCWKSLALISLTTFAVPLAAFTSGASLISRSMVVAQPGSTAPPTLNVGAFGTVVVVFLAAGIIGGFLTGVANAALVWTVTRSAAGRPAPLGGALGYGFANGIRLWGWSLLFGLMILLGTCACLLPGLYLGLAGCLYVPVALYRRGLNPISTSFSMINKNFGPALGRMALLVAIAFGVRLVLTIPVTFVSAASTTVGLVLSIVVQLVTAGLTLMVTVGTVLLFAELSAKQAPVTTAHLDAALG